MPTLLGPGPEPEREHELVGLPRDFANPTLSTL